MAKKPAQGLGELELEVMKELWARPEQTVQEVADALSARRELARTTVLTVIQRLHAKGYLKRQKVEGVYRFRPTRSRREVMGSLIGQFVSRVLDGSPAPFLAYLAESGELTDEQVNQLREMAQEIERQEEES